MPNYRPSIYSRHPSHSVLRAPQRQLPMFPFRSVVRLGSITVPATATRVQINSVQSIQTSSNKLAMKEAFDRANVKTAPWFTARTETELFATAEQLTRNWESALVCKKHYGSQGRGNTLVHSRAELQAWYSRHPRLNESLFELYMPYSNEYRIHVTSEGYFYTCRKAMRRDTPDVDRWHFHDSTCVWLLETNPSFNKPANWDEIVTDCVNALREVGADILSFDVKVQSAEVSGRAREYRDYILLECNSASSLGNPDGSQELSQVARAYIRELPRVIARKGHELNLFPTN